MHLGLTANDVWDTATDLQLVAAADVLLGQLARLREIVSKRALEHKDTVCVGARTACTPSRPPSG